ncbi:RDD family protein [Kitasatospora sp. NPDC127111]|uniref:RDD family protein n=1 Tax=Kitasatospora sp. NPDC127111 TaxID=3345363 RepID=UPI00363B2B70
MGVTLSTVGLRFGGFVLDWVLAVFTLFIGWLVWALFTFSNGQTPAKQILHMKTVHIPDEQPAGWWRMVLREFIARPLVAIVSSFLLFIPYFWLCWDRDRQELWDKMATTIVVTDQEGRVRRPDPVGPTYPAPVPSR